MRAQRTTHPTLAAALLLAVLLAAVGSASGQSVEVYEMDVLLAPVRLDGEYPVAILTEAGSTGGSLAVHTDADGKVHGQLTLSGVTLDVTGKVSHRPTWSSVKLKARTESGKIKLKGALVGDSFEGSSKGKGDLPVALGPGTFSLDVSAAGPTSVLVGVTVTRAETGKLKGDGSVHLGAEALTVRAKGKRTTSFKLKAKGDGFSFSGKRAPRSTGRPRATVPRPPGMTSRSGSSSRRAAARTPRPTSGWSGTSPWSP